MKQNINLPGSSMPSLIVWVVVALGMLAFCIHSAPAVVEELKTGQAYSLTVVFGNGNKVIRSDSPTAFWMNMGIQILGCLGGIVVGIGSAIGNILQYKKSRLGRKNIAVAKNKKEN